MNKTTKNLMNTKLALSKVSNPVDYYQGRHIVGTVVGITFDDKTYFVALGKNAKGRVCMSGILESDRQGEDFIVATARPLEVIEDESIKLPEKP